MSSSLLKFGNNKLGNAAWKKSNSRSVRMICKAKGGATVPATISVKKHVEYGEVVKLVGNNSAFGNWDPTKAVTLKWEKGDDWSVTVDVPVNVDVRFKLIRASKAEVLEWEEGDDRLFKAQGPDFGLHVRCLWNETQKLDIKALELSKMSAGGAAASQSHHSTSAPESNGTTNTESSHSSSHSKNGNQAVEVEVLPSPVSSISTSDAARGAWVGKDPSFVRNKSDLNSNRHNSWKLDGLDGVLRDIVAGDKDAPSWLQKMQLQKKLLVDKYPDVRPDIEALASLYIYATWINSGAVNCVESGGHQRPNRHADLSVLMFRSLECALDQSLRRGGPQNREDEMRYLAARRLHTRLPSISGEFRQSVPLTRIRDIAHRGDIPKELKDEIKHTLQNKLHRNAGPEDLVATEAMLARVTAQPGQYSESFVDEFRKFTAELRTFFNANDLLDLLASTTPSLPEEHEAKVKLLINAKARAESKPSPSLDDLMSMLFLSTAVRAHYMSGLIVGLRNDAPSEAMAMRQLWRLAEIKLEEFAFVVLSRMINVIEEMGGANTLSRAGNTTWSVPLAALSSGLRNLGLSQVCQAEVAALDNEIEAFFKGEPITSSREAALRMQASLERVVRLAGEFADTASALWTQPAAQLGNALGVPEHMAKVFAEAEVRASVAFQVSKLSNMMVKALRLSLGADGWDALVLGDAVGKLVKVESLEPKVMAGVKEDVVLLVTKADGDEELGPLGHHLRGVVLRHSLPHLSHLGVRARQERVTFATLDDEDYARSTVEPLCGQRVKLSVTTSGVKLSKADSSASNGTGRPAPSASAPSSSAPAITPVSSPTVVPMSEANAALCGSKATKCAALEVLAANSKGVFRAPEGCALPFGIMELCLKEAGKGDTYQTLLSQLESAPLDSTLDSACAAMRELLEGLDVPAASILDKVSEVFPPESSLVVRSSANVEDLAGMSAAGLYESVVGVDAANPSALRAAICRVWASLHSRRAVLARRAAGVKQADASMAVLIQRLVLPDVSFVLHTARPSDGDTGILMAELAPGQGETLASGTRGSPWRLEVTKADRAVKTLAFANFSKALLPTQDSKLEEREVDYSNYPLSTSSDYRKALGARLVDVGTLIEQAFDDAPQDIEGGVLGDDLYIFQTRPQM